MPRFNNVAVRRVTSCILYSRLTKAERKDSGVNITAVYEYVYDAATGVSVDNLV